MIDDAKNYEKAAVIKTLEEILAELDKLQLALPALKIFEALDILTDKRDDDLGT